MSGSNPLGLPVDWKKYISSARSHLTLTASMISPRIYRSPYPSPFVPTNLSISQLLEIGNPDDVEGDKIIFEDDWTNKRLSFSGIRKQSAKGAYGLRYLLGVNEGDSVFICAPNCVDVVKLIHAVLWCGATAVLVSHVSTEYELSHYLDISRPQIIAAEASTWSAIAGALRRQNSPKLRSVSVDDTGGPFGTAVPLSMIFDQKRSLAAFDLSTRDSRQHTACVCFSSGTSGKPKGVELSHYNLIASMVSLRATEAAYNNGSVRGVFFAPLCHIYGLMVVALLGSWLGYYTMMMKKFTLDSYLDLSDKVEATALRILPTIAVGISKQTAFDLSRLRRLEFIMCSGAVLPMPTIEFFRKQFPQAPIMQGYGMTEGNVTFLKPGSAHRVGSVGRLAANVEARVVDDDGNDVAEGEQGEMLVRAPSTFRRYMRNSQATRETFSGDWMKTGDIARVDRDGFWFLTERKKEMIKYKGNQVAPAELESILNSHPQVSEGAVCALWEEDQGTEIPIAYVTLTPAAKSANIDREQLIADIRDHVDERVAPYKKLRGGVVVLDELPKSATGKVLRRMLPARLARERSAKL